MIPMVDLKKQFNELKAEVFEMLTEIIENSHYILGPKVAEFEKKIADYHGLPDSVGVASGTDALHLSLRALGIGHGDEVITTPFTFFATIEAILYTGATPVFVDIVRDTMNIDPLQIEQKINHKTKALLPVHLFGHPADMRAIVRIAQKHNLTVVEDCAQAFGAEINGKRVGSFGDTGCFSFYPSKNLGAFGDGGMITVMRQSTADALRKLRNHGSKGSYVHELIGFNSRLDEIQAGVLLLKMERIHEYNRRRRYRAERYDELLSDTVVRPVEQTDMTHVFHQYTIRSSKRDLIQKRLRENKIASVIYYPVPLHLQEAVSFLGYGKGDFPVAEEAAERVLSLPIYPELEETSIKEIADIVNNV